MFVSCIGCVPASLLVVKGKVLDPGDDVLVLDGAKVSGGDAAPKKRIFSFRFEAPQIYSYSSAPAIASDGTIYVGVADKKIYAINPDGTLKWSTYTGSYGFSAPALSCWSL